MKTDDKSSKWKILRICRFIVCLFHRKVKLKYIIFPFHTLQKKIFQFSQKYYFDFRLSYCKMATISKNQTSVLQSGSWLFQPLRQPVYPILLGLLIKLHQMSLPFLNLFHMFFFIRFYSQAMKTPRSQLKAWLSNAYSVIC